MHYQIFIPGLAVSNPDRLKDYGLEDLLRHGNPDMWQGQLEVVQKGGTFCSWGNAPKTALSEWRWERCGTWFMGIDPGNPPTPFDLRAKQVYSGFDITLNDGHIWHIPHYQRVEHSFQIDENGEVVRAPAPHFREFTRRCEMMMETLFYAIDMVELIEENGKMRPAEEYKKITIKDGLHLAVEAISLNYRINAQIAVMLDLLTDQTVQTVLVNIVEMPEILREKSIKKFKKKRVSESVIDVGQPTLPGDPAHFENIIRPLSTGTG